MVDYFDALGTAVVDRSPDELIGAVLISLALSVAFAGLYLLGRRKVSGVPLMPMIGLMIVTNLISMALGAGYVLHARAKLGYLASDKPSGASAGPDSMLVEFVFRGADSNRDGLLSSEEASIAAAEFVRQADRSGRGTIDARSLGRALPGSGFHGQGAVGHPMPPFGPPPPGPPSHAYPRQLKLTPLQVAQLTELQNEVDSELEEILTDHQEKQLKAVRERGPDGFGP